MIINYFKEGKKTKKCRGGSERRLLQTADGSSERNETSRVRGAKEARNSRCYRDLRFPELR